MTQTDDVVRLVREVLEPVGLIGAYLHGSAVLGGLRPHSDIDVFAVVRRPTTAARRRALTEGLLAVSGHPDHGTPLRPVELTVAVQDDIRPWMYPPRCEFQYGEWLRDTYLRGVMPEPGPSPDLALLVTMVLDGRAPLLGPAPGDVLDPVPTADLARAMTAGVPELLAERDTDTRNVLLTLARIWTTLATGDIKSKDAAADWALERLPAEHRPVLARARAVYLGDEEERWDDLLPQVAPHAAYVVRAIEGLAPGGDFAP
ncbi:aminoglycoside adenylyltransferase family protein [Streptomyces kanamyceticus]|uniref:aminoglycoside adenylyltransferase family protein n=1 Tax=Streptomyces kanamyceticus TaxID=1967 RepID=UPI0006E15EC6|nr:aminoglycoside adenylyltransferase family protein [Streptomyces kanamyceticus]